MLFKAITEKDNTLISSFAANTEDSCENTFVNLFVWQKIYKNEYCFDGGQLFIRSFSNGEYFYALPMGESLKDGIEKLRRFCGGYPSFWVQDGKRFEEFKAAYGDKYTIIEDRDTFDYLYETESLATLSGKKYHSKRNHISAFSSQYDWKYEEITQENKDLVMKSANEWYNENKERLDEHMLAEKEGLNTLLDNIDEFNLSGGAVSVGDEIVAFTLASPINENTLDVHLEKALSKYSGAYSVINCEFAKSQLSKYRYLNREDDLGIEGLRRAKLSYKPIRLVKKYVCIPR